MEHTYMAWAMVAIGLGAVAAGGTGLFLPQGQRLTALLSLVLGAGVGVTSLFLQMVPAGTEQIDDDARAFLIASVLGLTAVIAGLGLSIRRSRTIDDEHPVLRDVRAGAGPAQPGPRQP